MVARSLRDLDANGGCGGRRHSVRVNVWAQDVLADASRCFDGKHVLSWKVVSAIKPSPDRSLRDAQQPAHRRLGANRIDGGAESFSW
jgi:hypothetical protein